MMSRVMVKGMGSATPGRLILMLTLVPRGPRSFSTASLAGVVLGRLALDLHDLVAALDAHVVGGRALDGRDHGGVVVPDVDGDAQAAELALGGHHQVLVVHRRQVVGVLVQLVQHALHAGLHDLLRIHHVHVVLDDLVVDLAQDLQVVVLLAPALLGLVGGAHHGDGGHQHQGEAHQGQDAGTDEAAPRRRAVVTGHVRSFVLEAGRRAAAGSPRPPGGRSARRGSREIIDI